MQLEKGKTYKIKLTSGAWVLANFLGEDTYGGSGFYKRKVTRYEFRNLASGRTITLKSQVKIREIAGGAL